MGTGNTIMTSNVVMLVLLAVLVVAGLAVSLIAIALATIRSVNGQVPQQPADVERKLKASLPRQRTAPPEPSAPSEAPAPVGEPAPPEVLAAPGPSGPPRAHARLSRSGR
ncbi:hypothetical protein GCM10017673_35420 [Streptosporangium violaceochromogenes]|nr:hypothetical protein GCM10017673_35420 [Streptosporangium violaceochromogenes]